MGFCGWHLENLPKIYETFGLNHSNGLSFRCSTWYRSKNPLFQYRKRVLSGFQRVMIYSRVNGHVNVQVLFIFLIQYSSLAKIWFLSRVPFLESDAAQIRNEACKNGEILWKRLQKDRIKDCANRTGSGMLVFCRAIAQNTYTAVSRAPKVPAGNFWRFWRCFVIQITLICSLPCPEKAYFLRNIFQCYAGVLTPPPR